MITAFHGIGAYRGQKNPLALKRALDTALSGVELCCADRPIGAFGAVLIGDHRATFDCDVWSEIGSDGERVITSFGDQLDIDDHFAENIKGDIEQKEYEKFCYDAMAGEYSKGSHHYCESWVIPRFARAIWVKDWANDSVKKCAYILAKNRGLPLIIVKGTTRIWDVLDFYNLPVRISA